MARYVYRHSHLWTENTAIVDAEIAELESWLRNSNIDPDFDAQSHVYVTDHGDRWIHLPELSNSQLFAMQMILSSSELYFQNRPVKFDQPPVTQQDLTEDADE